MSNSNTVREMRSQSGDMYLVDWVYEDGRLDRVYIYKYVKNGDVGYEAMCDVQDDKWFIRIHNKQIKNYQYIEHNLGNNPSYERVVEELDRLNSEIRVEI